MLQLSDLSTELWHIIAIKTDVFEHRIGGEKNIEVYEY